MTRQTKAKSKKTVLILAAHPDDEVLGCGGTIAKMASQGHVVHIHILGEGATSRYDSREQADMDQVYSLQETAQKVGKHLGAHSVTFSSLPDNRFDTVPLVDIIKIIEAKVEELQPEIVFTQHGGDLNIDHSRTFRATITALRPMMDSPTQELYAYEVNSSSEWAFRQISPDFNPNYFVDISNQLEQKISALALYDNEMRPFPHPRSKKGVSATNQYRGVAVGFEAAEAFVTIFRLS